MAQVYAPEQELVELSPGMNVIAWEVYTNLEGSVETHDVKKRGEKHPVVMMYPKLECVNILFDWLEVPKRPGKIRLRLWDRVRLIYKIVQNPEEYSGYAPPEILNNMRGFTIL